MSCIFEIPLSWDFWDLVLRVWRITQAHILDSEQLIFVFTVFLYNKIHSVNTIPDKRTEVEMFSTLGTQSSKKYIQVIDM